MQISKIIRIFAGRKKNEVQKSEHSIPFAPAGASAFRKLLRERDHVLSQSHGRGALSSTLTLVLGIYKRRTRTVPFAHGTKLRVDSFSEQHLYRRFHFSKPDNGSTTLSGVDNSRLSSGSSLHGILQRNSSARTARCLLIPPTHKFYTSRQRSRKTKSKRKLKGKTTC